MWTRHNHSVYTRSWTAAVQSRWQYISNHFFKLSIVERGVPSSSALGSAKGCMSWRRTAIIVLNLLQRQLTYRICFTYHFRGRLSRLMGTKEAVCMWWGPAIILSRSQYHQKLSLQDRYYCVLSRQFCGAHGEKHRTEISLRDGITENTAGRTDEYANELLQAAIW